ncbi:hypothetical protein SEMRO_773_G200450.1 [Seminavis robusta]|uniref:Uncharacterized protein n=1 Tax=Seminavis robusta TaxID=568900 RepID=A0A9N8HMU8_9STRA|nr:hypothetical protein SEMRO_773_G200450.1 [Seminavis robusta]|eukprot:Sro773_g200450.1 n/a (168) ;mRNA; r:24182-24685
MLEVWSVISKLDRLWRKLSVNTPPKVHSWQHLGDNLERLRGMLYHQESKIEVAHQVGKATDLRFRALGGNIERKIACSLQYQANLADPQVKSAQEEVRAARARNFSEDSKRKRQDQAESKKKVRTQCLHDIVEAEELEGEYSSMIELLMADQRQATSSGTTAAVGGD